MGTAHYMPPELIRGEVPDARSDIYSLGVTLYEMLSGQPPFEADSAMSLLMMHLQEPVPDLHKLRPEVPEPLAEVVQRALAKDRDARYPTGGEMAHALEQRLANLDADLAVHLQATEIEQPASQGPSLEATLQESEEGGQRTGSAAQQGALTGPPGWHEAATPAGNATTAQPAERVETGSVAYDRQPAQPGRMEQSSSSFWQRRSRT